MMKIKRFIIIVLLTMICSIASAQFCAVRTNTLGWATGTINGAFEYSIGKRWSVDLPIYYNPFKESYLQVGFIGVQPGVKLWRIKPQVGSFWCLNGTYAHFDRRNVENETKKGNMIGAGISWGYAIPISTRWNLITELGIGAYHCNYEKKKEDVHYTEHEYIYRVKEWYILPSRLEVSFCYLF